MYVRPTPLLSSSVVKGGLAGLWELRGTLLLAWTFVSQMASKKANKTSLICFLMPASRCFGCNRQSMKVKYSQLNRFHFPVFLHIYGVPVMSMDIGVNRMHMISSNNLAWCGKMRLALVTILNIRMDDCLVLIGLLCSSFVAINRATNKRFPFNPLGDERFEGVKTGNLLVTRTLGFWRFREWIGGSRAYCILKWYI